VANALAVLAIADVLNLDIALVTKAMGDFTGVRRRFELKGEAGGIAVVDDYAHHPTEIQATLAAARQRYGLRPLWVFFQPHTYTRTKALLDEFAASFGNADHVIVSPIYGSREYDNLGLSTRDLTRRMVHPDVRAVDSLQEAGEQLLTRLQQGDVLLTLGAGDGYRVGEAVLQALRERDKAHGCSSAGGRCCEPALFEVAAREH
jgi:UDP-N-acetylmuramate--alanine ligase